MPKLIEAFSTSSTAVVSIRKESPPRRSSSKGMTLLELLVAMAIAGILAAIAVPQYNDYKKRGFDLRALSDLHSIALAQEAYFIDSEEYLSCSDSDCLQLPGIAALSAGVEISVEADEIGFRAEATHPQGTGKMFR